MRYIHVRTYEIKTLFKIQTHQFLHLCALRGFVKKGRSRVGREPEADPEFAKPDVHVPKTSPPPILFHRHLTMPAYCHSRRSAILLLMYLHHAVYNNPKLRSTRSLNSDWPDNLMARRAESCDWSTCMHAQRHIPIICLGLEAVLSH